MQLLGNYLVSSPNSLQAAEHIPARDRDRSEGHHARRVLEAWTAKFGTSSAEAELLRLLYLFDRPLHSRELSSLVQLSIPGLCEHLPGIDSTAWIVLVETLRKERLLAPSRQSTNDTLDAHPVIRSYFGEYFEGHTELSHDAHRAIAQNIQIELGSPPQDASVDADSLRKAYEAIRHTLAAGDFECAMEMHWKYVRGGDRHFLRRNYSLLNTDLAMWSEYFKEPWVKLKPRLDSFGFYRPHIFSEASWDLYALGRLEDAVPRHAML